MVGDGWVTRRGGRLGGVIGCVCHRFDYPATCGPKGHGSQQLRCCLNSERCYFPPVPVSKATRATCSKTSQLVARQEK